ncbi:putative membrane protein [[Clostridium] sordellii ATCC 9714]|nr:putative membrane protein [[Clostridium] sordellii ATCC 9714] [Paeniclostridium sordellii ATCC 9714]
MFKGFVAIIVGCIVALIFNDSGIVAAGTGSIYILIPLLVMSVNMMIFDKE